MPIKKRFSKKHMKKMYKKTIKNSKNNKKSKKNKIHKKTTRRKYKKISRKRFFGGEEQDKDCPICQEPLEKGEIFETDCKPISHKFHLQCIQQWCNTCCKNKICSCPTCRAPIQLTSNVLDDLLFKVEVYREVYNPNSNSFVEQRIPAADVTATLDVHFNFVLAGEMDEEYPGLQVRFLTRPDATGILEGSKRNTTEDLIKLENDTLNNGHYDIVMPPFTAGWEEGLWGVSDEENEDADSSMDTFLSSDEENDSHDEQNGGNDLHEVRDYILRFYRK